MNFKNGKRKIGLIALLSCVFTATVAFAAYTGYNYINGTVTVEGSPFKMVFATSGGTTLETGGTISAADHATVEGAYAYSADAAASDLDVSADGTKIEAFNVTLKEKNDMVTYSFKITNTGGSTAYLGAVDIAKTAMPKDSTNNDVTGLAYSIELAGVDSSADYSTFTLTSEDGSEVSSSPDGSDQYGYLSVATGESVEVTLTVKATDDNLFSAWDPAADDGQGGTGAYGATITLGEIKITWSAVDPSQATT